MLKKQDRQVITRKSATGVRKVRAVCRQDQATYDSGAIRFGSGCAPAVLRKQN